MKVDITASVVIHKAHPLLRPKLREQVGFPGGSNCKESACNWDLGSIPGSGRSPGEGNGKPLQYSCQESSHGQRSLVGYSPWGPKELDMTEWLTFTLWVNTSRCNEAGCKPGVLDKNVAMLVLLQSLVLCSRNIRCKFQLCSILRSFFFLFSATSHSTWDASSLTRALTNTSYWKHGVLTIELPEKSNFTLC